MDLLFFILFFVFITLAVFGFIIGHERNSKTITWFALIMLCISLCSFSGCLYLKHERDKENEKRLLIENCVKDSKCKVETVIRTCLVDKDAKPFQCKLHLDKARILIDKDI